jgi:N-acylglucosamine-6-phosphate 2-epimerase
MNDIKLISVNGEPSVEDKKVMREGMLAYHASQGHPRVEELYTVILKNQSNNTIGMVIVTFRWQAMYINTLWVEESIRHQGWGTRLMKAVEEEAVKRGCYMAFTDTTSYQAPKFYEKLGYIRFAKLDDYPKGSFLSYYKKNLK